MLTFDIPGRGQYQLQHLVLDVNGTLAVDGKLIEGVAQTLSGLQDILQVHLVTADTRGRQAEIDQQLGVQAVRLTPGDETRQKADYVRRLGKTSVAAIGQGANDAGMLAEAALGVCVISVEGLAVETLQSADLLMPDILSALALFQHPLRVMASLRI